MNRFVVPVDHSPESWLAFDVAVELARITDASVEVIEVVFSISEVEDAARRLRSAIAARNIEGAHEGVEIDAHGAVESESVAAAIEFELEQHPGAIAVMASHGRGRSAAVLGSVTDDVLRRTFGPVVVVGPKVDDVSQWASHLGGPIIIAVDGSEIERQTASLGAAWAIELGVTPWVVEVLEPAERPPDVVESVHASRLAHRVEQTAHHEIEFEVLHGEHPATEITEFAAREGAALIVAGTHGRSGLRRLALGSVAAAIVRHAASPVVLIRPPTLATD